MKGNDDEQRQREKAGGRFRFRRQKKNADGEEIQIKESQEAGAEGHLLDAVAGFHYWQ